MTKEELKKEAEEFARTGMSHPNEYEMYYCTFLKVAEPREKQIAELEETINKLREQFALRYDLEDKIKELQEQIERMKVCCNCDWSNYLPNGNCLDCDGKKNWKLKEIKEK